MLIGLLGLGLGVSVRSEPFDGLAKAHGAGAGYFTAQSDFSCTFMSAVRFMAFADRS